MVIEPSVVHSLLALFHLPFLMEVVVATAASLLRLTICRTHASGYGELAFLEDAALSGLLGTTEDSGGTFPAGSRAFLIPFTF